MCLSFVPRDAPVEVYAPGMVVLAAYSLYNNCMIKEYCFHNNIRLFVTDSLPDFLALESEGKTVIPILNDQNRKLPWPHCDYALENPEETDEEYLYRIFLRMNNLPWTIIETDRLIIREMILTDVPEFYRIYEDEAVLKYMEPLYENPDEEEKYTQDYINQIYRFYEYGIWTVIEKATGQVLGKAGLEPQKENGFPDLGFVIESKKRGLGYAYEACYSILNYAKKELGLSKIQARVHPDNIASVSLLKKLGFKDSGIKDKDLCLYIRQ